MEVQFKIFLTAVIFAGISAVCWMLLKGEKDVTKAAKDVFLLIFGASVTAIIVSLIWMIWTL